MNILQKLIWYIKLKRKNYRKAFMTAFCNNKMTDGDKYFIILFFAMILLCLTLHFAEKIDGTIKTAENTAKRAKKDTGEALKRLSEREYLIAHMLNTGYIRLDGVKRKVKLCDASGNCE